MVEEHMCTSLVEIEERIEALRSYLNYLIDYKASNELILEVSANLDYLLNAYHKSLNR
jgi:hypothetical protein